VRFAQRAEADGFDAIATGARPRHGREAIMAYYPKVLGGTSSTRTGPFGG
jgi:hypothetical protein